MKRVLFSALLPVMLAIAGCQPAYYSRTDAALDKIALVRIECRNDNSIRQLIEHILKTNGRVADWKLTVNDYCLFIDARFNELTPAQAVKLEQQLVETAGVIHVEIKRDRVPSGKL